jgi:conjugative transfer signal peptidase TraF
MKRRILQLTALGYVAIAASAMSPDHRCLVVNLTSSVPIGLYVWSTAPPQTGDFVLISLPVYLRRFAARRGYLPYHRSLLKFVAASTGDVVCRFGSRVWIGGHSQVWAMRTDALGRLLPHWQGCRWLQAGELFVLGSHSGSFDSRYFGPINRPSVLTVVRRICVFRHCDRSQN